MANKHISLGDMWFIGLILFSMEFIKHHQKSPFEGNMFGRRNQTKKTLNCVVVEK